MKNRMGEVLYIYGATENIEGMYVCMHACMHACMEGGRDGWMDGRMDGCIYICAQYTWGNM